VSDISGNLVAILGPTNTGKTHLAFDRLMAYKSGIFGFPLRLLARENYDKAVKRVGINNVALITGEEKFIPKEAKYFFCTVESIPKNLNVECVAIDEIQLASDYDRGHIFTEHLLNTRGEFETILLGSLTIKFLLLKIFSNIKIETRERFSKLTFTSNKNFSKLKPRTAVIAFNINSVYELAEKIRSHRGGAAVVLGSLSPRTRNFQVAMYEEKKVDYLVATDAIGMGLNLSIDHVSFSSIEKFDGKYKRNLYPIEIGQIAGRAGRYLNDGTFSLLKNGGQLDIKTIKNIEESNFDSITRIYWRNTLLDFSSVENFLASLKQFPVHNFFIHKKNAVDELNFRFLIDDKNIKKLLINKDRIKLLWDVCRIPDFQKLFNDTYLQFLKTIFLLLIKNEKIPKLWLEKNILGLQNFNGGIEELSLKISQVRTWTYISNHQNWIDNEKFWQETTHKIENDLSDNLHEGLTKRFVDSTSKYFIKSNKNDLNQVLTENHDKIITINNIEYGSLHGFNLKLNKDAISHSLFSLTHVKKLARIMIEEKINNFLNAPNESISFGKINEINFKKSINIYWGEEIIGNLIKGSNISTPVAEALNTEYINSENRLLISAKLQKWIDELIKVLLWPLKEDDNENISANIRAIKFNVFENLGTLPVEQFSTFLKNISLEDKNIISKSGIRIGAKYFFVPNFLKKAPMELSALLWCLFNDYKFEGSVPLPKDGRVSFEIQNEMKNEYWPSIGYIKIKKFALRVDVFERIFFIARQKIKNGPFLDSSDLMNPVGCDRNQLRDILIFCGFSALKLNNDRDLYYNVLKKYPKKLTKDKAKKINIKKNTKSTKLSKKNKKLTDPNSPFAVLKKLL
jgi:ATP-dependent RNA helicase SUPV3L1/SUV3